MNSRVNGYFHLPCTKALLQHFRSEIGLQGDYLKIFDELRKNDGDAAFHSDNLQMPLKRFNDKTAIVYQRCVWELVRLAELGLKAEQELTADCKDDTMNG